VSRCAWCGTDNDPAQTSCTSCNSRLGPLQEGEPGWAVPPESVAPPSGGGWAVSPQSAPVPAPPGILQSTTAVAYPPQPLPPPNWPAPTTMPGSPTKTSRSLPGALWVGVAILVLAVMGLVLFLKLQSHIGFPDTIAGYQHDNSQIAKAATDTMETYLKGVGIHAKTAIYGDIATPAFIVVAFETGGAPPASSLDDFVNGFNSSSGSGASIGHQVTQTRDGVMYKCGSIVSQHPGASFSAQAVCLWDDDSTGGFVVSTVSSDPKSAIDLAAQVHDAVIS
jgi:hypothetical protein